MRYNFDEIEARWQKYWAENETFKAYNPDNPDLEKELGKAPKYYVLDMFPYPSGAGLHVGHPLGYIASDIYARYKRHKGYNVLHPMGYDSFGLPAEQYAIQTGQHPAVTTEENIKTYRRQLDQLGFSFDWSREVRTSDPKYYKWTQWVFIQLFNSWYNKDTDKAEDITALVAHFEKEGNTTVNAACDEDTETFTAADWAAFSNDEKEEILLQYRLTYLSDTEVNWCPALGTVLANDEIVNGVSERGGHPVERKKMRQWSMRITAYAQRLLDGLEKIDWPEPLKDAQRNWIGRSEGAMVRFPILGGNDLPLTPSQGGGTEPRYRTSDSEIYGILLERAKKMRKNPTKAEKKLWQELRNKNLGFKFRRQHPIFNYIVDFVCIEKNLIIEVDGKTHDYQLTKDDERQLLLEEKKGFTVLRYTNEEVLNDIDNVLAKIKDALNSPSLGGGGGEVNHSADVMERKEVISVFTTRPDTIFGVSFMTLAPEHELVEKITVPEQKEEVEAYVKATAKRSELDRMADVKTISGVFTGAYAEHPFTKEPIPIWIGDYVLAGYGTGAVMSVPCGDQRDYDFAKHFNLPVPNIFKDVDISEEAFSDKENTVIANSDFLNDLTYEAAMETVLEEIEKQGVGYRKVNYRMRDAVFSRQRYWGEPFPVFYVNGLPKMIDEKHLPLELPEVEKYLPTEDGKPPLGNADVWAWNTGTNNVVDNNKIDNKTVFPLELNTMPGWAGSSQYFNRYMDPHNDEEIFSRAAIDYWRDVDLYIGGSEHATGHLLYSRFWQKFMFDKGLVPKDEFAKKLINQGMILGRSAIIYRISGTNKYVSKGLKDKYEVDDIRVDVNLVNSSNELDIAAFRNWRPEYKDAVFVCENGEVLPLAHSQGGGTHSPKYLTGDGEFASVNLKRAKAMRAEPTNAEALLWQELRSKKLGVKFRQQHLIDTYIVDFVCLSKKLIVEVDGEIHRSQKEMDDERTLILESKGYTVIRFTNDVVLNNIENVLSKIKTALNSPSLGGGRGEDPTPTFLVHREPEKMSKSKYNVVNPDAICKEYGADSLRLYEMFLGPLEQSKPWNTAGISGVFGFLKKLWKLYHTGENGAFHISESPLSEDLETAKILHKTIKKVEEDIENFSFNTSVSTFMIAVNELTTKKCTDRAILEPLLILISPYAPHIAEELWSKLGHTTSISKAPFPKFEEKYLVESTKTYPISFNGKMRFTMDLPLDLSKEEIEEAVMDHEKTKAQLAGRTPKKIIVVPGKIVNIVG